MQLVPQGRARGIEAAHAVDTTATVVSMTCTCRPETASVAGHRPGGYTASFRIDIAPGGHSAGLQLALAQLLQAAGSTTPMKRFVPTQWLGSVRPVRWPKCQEYD